MEPAETQQSDAAQSAVSCKTWLDALGWHIDRMKSVEEKYRRESDDARIKADVMQRERIELENRIADTTKRI